MKERKVRLFISSTFQDMNEERDYLNNYIFPQIKNYCKSRFIDFIPVDLRWGITEEESKNGLVVASCIQEVDNARPFFIGILGQRYGWMPTAEELNCNHPSISKNKEWLLRKVMESASITEIEMDYAALRDSTIPYALFFIKDNDASIPMEYKERKGSIAEKKLEMLKEKIKLQTKYPVYTYKDPKKIGEVILSKLISMIDIEFPQDGYDYQKSIITKHELSLERHAFSLYEMHTIEQDIEQWGKEGYKVLLVVGNSGSGTSNVIAQYTQYMRNNFDIKVIYYDFECADSSNKDLMDDFEDFLKLKTNYIPEGKWTLISIDNVSLLDVEQTDRMIKWVNNLPSNIHPVFAASDSTFSKALSLYRAHTIFKDVLSEESKYEMIDNFTRRCGKRLTKEQQEKIVQCQFFNNPTVLSIMLETLINYGSHEKLNQRIDNLVYHSDYFFSALIQEYEIIFKQVNKYDCFIKSLAIIAMHGDWGIREDDLLAMNNFKMSDWSVVRPMIMQFCKTNQYRLRFVQSKWSYAVKSIIEDTKWISHLAYESIKWWVDNVSRIKEAANSIAVVYLYIWHLPYEEVEDKFIKEKLLSIMLSPDTVKIVQKNFLSSLWSFIWFKDISYNHSCSIIGRPYNQLSHLEKIEYFRTMMQIAEGQNRTEDIAHCYRNLALLQTNKKEIYEAHAYLSEGRVDKAIRNVTVFLNFIRGTKIEQLEKHLILLKSYLINFSEKSLIKELEKIISLAETINEEELSQIRGELISSMISFAYCSALKGQKELVEIAIEILYRTLCEESIKDIGVCSKDFYYLYMAKALLDMRSSQFETMISDAYNALTSSELVYGSSSYQYGRAHILLNYAYIKQHGKLYDDRSKIENFYRVPLFEKNFNNLLADDDVKNEIIRDNKIYYTLVKELGVEDHYGKDQLKYI